MLTEQSKLAKKVLKLEKKLKSTTHNDESTVMPATPPAPIPTVPAEDAEAEGDLLLAKRSPVCPSWKIVVTENLSPFNPLAVSEFSEKIEN